METMISGVGRSTMLSAGADLATLEGTRNLLVMSTGDDTLTAEGDGNTIYSGIYRDAFEDVTVDGGDDVLNVVGDRNEIIGGGGAERITIEGDNNRVFSGSGADNVTVDGDENYIQLQGDGTVLADGDDNIVMMRGFGLTEVEGDRNVLMSTSTETTLRAIGLNNSFDGLGLIESSGDGAEFYAEGGATIKTESLRSGSIYVYGVTGEFVFNGDSVSYKSGGETAATLTVTDDEIAAAIGFDTDATISGLSNATVDASGTIVADGITYALSVMDSDWADGHISLHGGAIYGLDDAEYLSIDRADVITVNGSVLTVEAGDRVFGLTDWAGVHMSNLEDDTLVKGTDGNDFIIDIGSNVTIDGGLGVDAIELLINDREYVSVGLNTSVTADLFDYGFEATSDAMIFEGDGLMMLTAEFTGDGVLFSMLNGGSILTTDMAEDSVNVNVVYSDVVRKMTAIESGSSVAFNGEADYYLLGATGTLTGVTGLVSVDDIIIETNGTVDVVGRRHSDGFNAVANIYGVSAGDTLKISSSDGSSGITYEVSADGTTITRSDNGREVWSGTAEELSALDFLTIDYQEYYGDKFTSRVEALLDKYVTFSDGSIVIDAKGFRENLAARIERLTGLLDSDPTADEVMELLTSDLNELFGVDLTETFSDVMVDSIKTQVEAALESGGNPFEGAYGILQSILEPVEHIFWGSAGKYGLQTFAHDEANLLAGNGSIIENLGLDGYIEQLFKTLSGRRMVHNVVLDYRDRVLEELSDGRVELKIEGEDGTQTYAMYLGASPTVGSDVDVIMDNYEGSGANSLTGTSGDDAIYAGAGDTVKSSAGADLIVFGDGSTTVEATIDFESSSPLKVLSAEFADAHSRQVVEIGTETTSTVIGFEVGWSMSDGEPDVIYADDLTELAFEFGDEGLTVIDGAGRMLLARDDSAVLESVSSTATSDSRTPEGTSEALLIADGAGLHSVMAYASDREIEVEGGLHYIGDNTTLKTGLTGRSTVIGFNGSDALELNGLERVTTLTSGDDLLISVSSGVMLLKDAATVEGLDVSGAEVIGLLEGEVMTVHGGDWTFGAGEYGTVEATDEPTFIDSGSYDLTVVMGANTTLKTSAGATVMNYDPVDNSGFIADGAVGFADNRISLGAGNEITGLTSNAARIFDAEGSTLAIWTSSDGVLDRSGATVDEYLIANVDGSTVISGSGHDTIDLRAEGVKVRYGDGRDTVLNFDDDILYQDNYSDKEAETDGNGIRFFDRSNSIVLEGITGSTALTWAFGTDETVRAAYVVDGDDFKAEPLIDQYIGLTRNTGVDFSAIDDDVMVDATSYAFNNIGRVTLGGGASTFCGDGHRETVTAGVGADEIMLSKGRDVIYDFDVENDSITAGGDFGVKVKGDDLLIKSADGSSALLVDLATVDAAINIDERKVKAGSMMTYSDDIDEYIGATNATLKVEGDGEIWLGLGNYDNVRTVDASDSDGDVLIAGTDKSDLLIGGAGANSLWGGVGGRDTLVGGDGSNEFYYGLGNGLDVITDANDDDVLNLLGISLDDIRSLDADGNSVTLKFTDGGRLNIRGEAELNYELTDGTYTLDREKKALSRK